MKKISTLPFFALIALVSQAWGEYASCAAALGNTYFCQWPGGCYEINKGKTDAENCQTNYDNCKKDGYLYISVTSANTGDGKKCNGTWANDGFDPGFNGGIAIWCQWSTGCQQIKHDSTLTKCESFGYIYINVADDDVGDGKICKNSGTWSGQGRDPNATSSSSIAAATPSSSSTAATISSSSEAATTVSSSSETTATTSSSSVGTTQSSSSSGTSPSSSSEGTDPIISHNRAPVFGLSVVNFARNLRIGSDKNATVSLFDINGKQVLSQKVQSGTTTISLEKQKVGVYYAVAKSGSQKQIVKIVLK